MSNKNLINESQNNQLSLQLINKNIEKLPKDYKISQNNSNNSINENIPVLPKINEIIELLYKKKKYKNYFGNKFKRYSILLSYKKNIKIKRYNDNEKKKITNDAICHMSIYILQNYINNKEHNNIQEYLKLLLFFIVNDILKISNFILILDIFLKSILDMLNDSKLDNSCKLYRLKNEPLLFINDIIEGIINYPIQQYFIYDSNFVEELIELFNKFLSTAKKQNIYIEKDELWLKLFENKDINKNSELYNNKLENTYINKYIDFFLINIYKNHIPKYFYNEIYKKSAIDLPYYLNCIEFMRKLFSIENEYKFKKIFKIKNGINILGNSLQYENINFKTDEFSLIFSFKITEIKNEEDIILFNLNQKAQRSIIRILINKDNELVIKINTKSEWKTKIKIIKDKFYFCCLIFKKKEEIIFYINTDEKSNIINGQIMNKYTFKKIEYPEFGSSMIIQLGKKNLYGIFGDIHIINKMLNEKNVNQLFNSNEYYSKLIYKNINNINDDLIRNKIYYSKICKNAINQFKGFNYKNLLMITPNSFFKDIKMNNTKDIKVFQFKTNLSIIEFLNNKGIDFLIFMLHNINSHITDNKIFNLYLYKTIDFLYNTIKFYQEVKNNILEDENGYYDSYFEINEEDSIQKINIFFLSLLAILKEDQNNSNNVRTLSDEVRNSMINCLSLKFNNFYFHKNIIMSLLYDTNLFNQKKYTSELNNNILDKYLDIHKINDELIYKIFLLDFLFELKTLKHKKYSNFIGSLIDLNNNYINEIIVKYITNLKSEVKIYHYLKLIYCKINPLKKSLEDKAIFDLFKFVEINLGTLKKEHCKYCSYTIILSYLIREEILVDKNKDIKFVYNTFGYMTSPSFLFIRCIFIHNFELDNYEKLKFIKSKDEKPYNMDYLDSLQKNIIKLYDINKFIIRFESFIKYIDFLFSLKRDNLKNILDNFFLFIIEFIHKIQNTKIVKKNNKDNVDNYIKVLFNSQAIINFFMLYLRYNKEEALKTINDFIKCSLFKFSDPFIIYILSPEAKIGKKKNYEKIKIEIIKMFILEIIKNKNLNDDIVIFLLLIYKNIYEENIGIQEDFPKLFFSICDNIISDNNIFLDMHPLDLNYFEKKKNNYVEDIKKNKVKFLSEIIMDIIFKFYFEGNYYSDLWIKNLLIKENSSTIFYLKDINNLKNIKKKSSKMQRKLSIFKNENNNFLFCLYFLIVFLKKLDKYKNRQKEKINVIHSILEALFNDLKKIYDNYKIPSIYKKNKNCEDNLILYNKILDIYNKNYRSPNFSFQFILEKYSIINQNDKTNNQLNYLKTLDIDDLDEIDNYTLSRKNTIKKSKSFEKKVTNHIKEKYLNPDEERYTSYLIFDNNILNQSMCTPIYISINKNEKPSDSCSDNKGNNKEEEKYLKKKLSKINIVNHYYKEITEDFSSYDSLSMLFNPKEYFIWKNFTPFFKDYIFNNRKFKKLSKAYDMHIRNIPVLYSSEKDKEFFLNYPSKVKNYIIDEYYRPFLKPCLNFFNQKYIKQSHIYIKENLLINPQFKEDNFNSIKFKRIIPIFEDEKEQSIKCERFQNKGNIFGYIVFNNGYMIFKNSPEDDERDSKDLNAKLKYIYSIYDDSIIDRNKYNIIFYKDIKEIIKRRICFNYIGYEIFMKDNHSYLFNFFNKQNINCFLDTLKNYTQDTLRLSLKNSFNEETKRKGDKNLKKYSISFIKNSNSINKDNNDYGYKIIDDPLDDFKKMQYKKKYKKGELSNFNYLLLINKYSSRSYNDYNQYLIFPLLFMDVERKRKRNLSMAISLNKENNSETRSKIMANKKNIGCYFNQHYSTGGFILYYLVRLVPFTFSQIEFQSGKFDLPARLFSSLKNFLFFLNITYDNRELIPEFYFNYEFLLNLNYNDFGILKTEDEYYHLHNVETKKNETFLKYIINMRHSLEQTEISSWIDNIFGAKQFFDSEEQPNSFPFYSYESFCEFEKIKEDKSKSLEQKIEEIQQNIAILKFGITPAKIFNNPHPNMNKDINNELEEERNIFEKKEKKIAEIISDYIIKKSKEKEKFYFMNNNNNNNEIELILKFHNKIDIFKLKLGESKYNEFSINTEDQVEMDSYSKIFCEVLPQLYCVICNNNNTIQFTTIKKVIKIYQWTCMITAIDPFNKKKSEDKNTKNVIIGDENGYIHIMQIEYEISQHDKSYEIISVYFIKSMRTHISMIKGITYDERLNIIISWSDEGVISINNDYSLVFLNNIDLGVNCEIKKILVSKYDTLIVYCKIINKKKYKIICFTLSGIQVTYCEDSVEVMEINIDENINVVHLNRNIFKYNFDNLYSPNNILYSDYNDIDEGNKINIKHCVYIPKINKFLIIYSNNKVIFQEIDYD